MRVASYNILDGGEGRADPLAEVILAQRADVVGVVEADNPAVLHRLSQRLEMDFVVASGQRHAVALFSRWTIGDSINLAALHADGPRCLLSAEVTTPSGAVWPVGVLHLSPRADESDESRREVELAVAARLFEPLRAGRTPHLLMGDFNSNSPVQQIVPENCKPKTCDSWHRNGGRIPRRVVQSLLDMGYIDTLHAARPHEAANLGSFTTQHPGQRVDYIVAWGIEPGSVKDAWIEHDRLAKYASDHFPVGCEIGD